MKWWIMKLYKNVLNKNIGKSLDIRQVEKMENDCSDCHFNVQHPFCKNVIVRYSLEAE